MAPMRQDPHIPRWRRERDSDMTRNEICASRPIIDWTMAAGWHHLSLTGGYC
jgi:hypothetical protein